MKRKIRKILGLGLTIMMVLSLMMFFAPAATAADWDENEWSSWGLPDTDADTDIGPMAIAPDGTIYKAVWDIDEDELRIDKSEDNGYSWDATELDDLDPSWWDGPADEDDQVVQIVIGKNYEDDELVYVATLGGTIYRLEEAGEGDVIAIRDFPYPHEVDELYSIDTWYDGDDNWILAGTDEGVFEIMDSHGGDWVDFLLLDYHGDPRPAYEVAYGPDFDNEELMWVITEGRVDGDHGNFVITSTKAPGQWGQVVGEVGIPTDATPWVDLDFPDNYDSDPNSGDLFLFAALSSDNEDGGVYLIEGVDEDDGDSYAIELFEMAGEGFEDTNIVSIAVSGDYPDCVILAGALSHPTVYWSDDGGEDWSEADRNPTGFYPSDDASYYDVPYDPEMGTSEAFSWTHVYMEADITWGNEVFDPEESTSFVSTMGFESAVSRSDPNEDGDLLYNQVGEIDTEIGCVYDMGFHPDFPDPATFLIITRDYDSDAWSLWRTDNGDEDDPDFIRILCAYGDDPPAPGNFSAERLELVEFSQDGDAIFLFGEDDDWDESIWRSTDDGVTFGKKRGVSDAGDQADITDWVITDSRTIYASTDSDDESDLGFYRTTNAGLSWSAIDTDGPMNDIALQSGFDADDDDMSWIALGGMNGEVWLSDNAGDSFGDASTEDDVDLTDDVFVAFDADFADEDADGYMLIYAAGWGDDVREGDVADTDDVDWGDLEDDDDVPQEVYATGLQVAEDNALYVMSAGTEYDPGTAENVTVSGEVAVEWGGEKWEILPPEVVVLPLIGVIDLDDELVTHVTGDFIDDEVLNVLDGVLVTSGLGELSGSYTDIDYSPTDSVTITATADGVTGTFSKEYGVDITLSGSAWASSESYSTYSGTFTLDEGGSIRFDSYNSGYYNLYVNFTVTPGGSVDVTTEETPVGSYDMDHWFPIVNGTISVEGSYSGATGDIVLTDYVVEMPWLIWELILDDWGWILPEWQQGIVRLVVGANLTCEVSGEPAEEAEFTGAYRLLLHESNNEWECEGDDGILNPWGLWLTSPANVLWTISECDEVWVLWDTLSGSPTLASPPSGYQSEYEDEMRIDWNEMPGIDEDYEFKYYHLPTDSSTSDLTDDTGILLTGLRASSEYEWKVRAAAQSSGNDTWSSRWSGMWSWHTALGEPPWAPDLYTPGGVWQYSGLDVELVPAFSWESAKTADSYQFVLADNAEFASPLVNEKVPESAYNLDFELEYNTNYFWRIMAYKGNDGISRWSDIGAFTTISEPGAPPPSPAPPATVTQPAPAPIVIPTPIPPVLLWVIVGIGAVLIIAVIILIVRTRRAV